MKFQELEICTGGLKGVEKLIESEDLGTIELSTGIQISGKFTEVISDKNQRAVYIKTSGPTALTYKNKEIILWIILANVPASAEENA